MTTRSPSRQATHVEIGAGSVFMILAAVATALIAFDIATAARRALGWALAAVVVAALIDPLVTLLDRHIPRLFAVLVSFVAIGLGLIAVTAGLLHGLDTQIDRLQTEAPRAAAALEQSSRFAELAKRMDLTTRVREVVERLDDPTTGVLGRAASSSGGYLVGGVLCIFLLSWGPRMVSSALDQLDERRRHDAQQIATVAFRRARRYSLSTLGLATLSGTVVGLTSWMLDLPGPSALGVAVAACSVIPGIGVVVGALPALLIQAGLDTSNGATVLVVVVLATQVGHTLTLQRVVVPHSLVVGPAVVAISLVLGFGIYGLGGAYFSAAIVVFVVALLDAAAEQRALKAGSAPRPTPPPV